MTASRRKSSDAVERRGRRHLPFCQSCLSGAPCRTPEPHSAQGHVGDRKLPHRSPWRSCRSLRGLRRGWRIAYNSRRNRHCPTCRGAAARICLPSERPTSCRSATSMSCSPCPPKSSTLFPQQVVYAKAPFAGPAAVLAYLSRYSAPIGAVRTHRTRPGSRSRAAVPLMAWAVTRCSTTVPKPPRISAADCAGR